MIFENLEVKHKSFGDGTVIAKSGQYITVQFATTKKVFVYPDIFEKFLTPSDGTVSDEILEDIKATNLAKQKVIDTVTEENYRAMTKGIVIPGKENNPELEDEEGGYKSTELEDY